MTVAEGTIGGLELLDMILGVTKQSRYASNTLGFVKLLLACAR